MYPAGVNIETEQKVLLTNEEIERLQNTPNEDGVLPLLPSGWNVSFERKYVDDNERKDDTTPPPMIPPLR